MIFTVKKRSHRRSLHPTNRRYLPIHSLVVQIMVSVKEGMCDETGNNANETGHAPPPVPYRLHVQPNKSCRTRCLVKHLDNSPARDTTGADMTYNLTAAVENRP